MRRNPSKRSVTEGCSCRVNPLFQSTMSFVQNYSHNAKQVPIKHVLKIKHVELSGMSSMQGMLKNTQQ